MRVGRVLWANLAVMAISAAGLPHAGRAQPATTTHVEQVTATVESVDRQDRSVLLSGPNGGLLTIKVGPAVKNLAQVKPGDRVVVRYEEGLAARIAKPGEERAPPTAGTQTTTAPPGARPGGTVRQEIRARVVITGIDYNHNTVSFVGPRRVERVVDVQDPEMQRFLHTLKVGDTVDLTYTEALAISVEPAGS